MKLDVPAFIRPVRLEDLDSLLALARLTGGGLTSLPPERDILERRILASLQAFQQRINEPTGQSYLFVLEQGGSILGTSGITSKTGGFEPFYAYRLSAERFESETLGVSHDVPILELVAEHNGPAEIGSLFLAPDCQGSGWGGLLSRSRFLFIAQHPKLFESIIVAELRGVIDKNGNSPFWDAIGKHFFGVDDVRADYQSVRDKKFIAELMPRHPIYIPTLPKAAQAVIGEVHPDTLPAMRMLEREGFQSNHLVDIFEAGPVLDCERQKIRTVRESKTAILAEIADPGDAAASCLIGNTDIDFRACQTPVRELEPGQLRIAAGTAAALVVRPGDALRHVPPPLRATSRTNLYQSAGPFLRFQRWNPPRIAR